MHCTLVFPMKDEKILLGMKKRGFGEGKWNGFGGKIQESESVVSACIRELNEECSITCKEEDLELVAKLKFHEEKHGLIPVEVFLLKNWSGEPKESEEMKPQWFLIEDIPFHSMWDDDSYWLMRVLNGEKLEAEFFFDENNQVKRVGYIRDAKHL